MRTKSTFRPHRQAANWTLEASTNYSFQTFLCTVIKWHGKKCINVDIHTYTKAVKQIFINTKTTLH
jgi:hypothetical protein